MTPPASLDALPLLLTVDEVAALLRTTRKAIYAKGRGASSTYGKRSTFADRMSGS